MKRSLYRLLALTLAFSPMFAETPSVQIPPLQGETFAGETISLPAGLHGKSGVLVIGFTQFSREAVTQWGTWLAHNPAMAAMPYFELPVLAGVPKVLRGFVTGRVKAAVADAAKPHFLPVLDHEAEWRSLARYAAPDDAYVLVVDGAGFVLWQTHGPPTDQSRATLQEQIVAARGR